MKSTVVYSPHQQLLLAASVHPFANIHSFLVLIILPIVTALLGLMIITHGAILGKSKKAKEATKWGLIGLLFAIVPTTIEGLEAGGVKEAFGYSAAVPVMMFDPHTQIAILRCRAYGRRVIHRPRHLAPRVRINNVRH